MKDWMTCRSEDTRSSRVRDGSVLIDAVLLSAFANVKKHEKALDLGTGTGILPILLEAKYPGLHYTGLEIQEESADMARRSVSHNGLKRGSTL